MVHLNGETEEIVSALSQDSLSFRARIIGQSEPVGSVEWTIDGTPYTLTTGADLVLPGEYLAVGRHTVQGSVTEAGGTAQYAYTFDVTPATPVAQNYDYYKTYDTPLSIPDRKSVVSAIRVDDAFSVASLEVEIHVTHPRPSDLTVSLTSPAGTVVGCCR